MTLDVAGKAIDFLITRSSQRDLSISFFGGEPLINLPVIKHAVSYAMSIEQSHGKYFRFHITTNGTLLTEEILTY